MPDRLAPNVHLLDLGIPAPLGSNVFLVEDDGLTLVDAGLPFTGGRIRREIRAAGRSIEAVDLDHVGGLPGLYPDLDAPVYIGEADLGLLDGTWNPPLLHPKGLFHRGARRVFRFPAGLEFRPVADGDRIGGFTAYHTPGHNPGHTVYLHEALGVALLGDLVWEDGGQLTTPEWYDSYDLARMRASVRRFAQVSPPFDLACMAHGRPLTSGGQGALRALADRLSPA